MKKNTKIISNYLKRLKVPRKNIFKKNLAFTKTILKIHGKLSLKDVIGKTKINENRLPKKIALENKEITDQKTIAEKFNEFYVNVGPNLASKIPQNNNDYKSYLPDITTLFDEQDLTEQELKEAVASLKPNKSPGCDSIHVNLLRIKKTSFLYFSSILEI